MIVTNADKAGGEGNSIQEVADKSNNLEELFKEGLAQREQLLAQRAREKGASAQKDQKDVQQGEQKDLSAKAKAQRVSADVKAGDIKDIQAPQKIEVKEVEQPAAEMELDREVVANITRSEPMKALKDCANMQIGEILMAIQDLRNNLEGLVTPEQLGKIIKDQGINIDACQENKFGATPLLQACKAESKDIVKILLSAGANIAQREVSGLTPMHYAAQNMKDGAEIVNLLVAAFLSPINLAGNTPLHFAAKNGNQAVVERLIALGTNAKLKNTAGKTPQELAQGQFPIVGGQQENKAAKLAGKEDKKDVKQEVKKEVKPEEPDECPICLDAIVPGTKGTTTLTCKTGLHSFHTECINGTIGAEKKRGEEPRCPICRDPIDPNKRIDY